MVLPLLSLPAELQSLFVVLLVDVVTAGRLAQACSECKELLVERLLELRKERRAAEQARNEEQRTRKRNAILGCFENIDGGAYYQCKDPRCMCRLRATRGRDMQVLLAHLKRKHAVIVQLLQLEQQP